MTERNTNTKILVMTALMASMVFVATYLIRIPNPATGGYSHLGDCMIFLAVVMLGRKYGAAAGALGGAMSDLLAGAAIYIVPTLIIKYIMAFIMGTIMLHAPASRKSQIAGAFAGGLFQIIAYTLVKIVIIGPGPAIASVPNVFLQTLFGIMIFGLLSVMLGNRISLLTGGEAK